MRVQQRTSKILPRIPRIVAAVASCIVLVALAMSSLKAKLDLQTLSVWMHSRGHGKRASEASMLEEAMEQGKQSALTGVTSVRDMMRYANAETMDLLLRMPQDLESVFAVLCSALCASNCSSRGPVQALASDMSSCRCFAVLDQLPDRLPDEHPDVAEWVHVTPPMTLLPNRYKFADICKTVYACNAKSDDHTDDPECTRKARKILKASPPSPATAASLLQLGARSMRRFASAMHHFTS